MNVAIITARGGSKRIPNKNIKHFNGNPLISYSIRAALNSKLFKDIIVSTDSKEISEISLEYGASVPFLRSEKNSDDFSTTADVLVEVLNNLKDVSNDCNICCIYPTAPLLTSAALKNSFEVFQKNDCTGLIPIVEFGYPIQRSLVSNNNYIKFREEQYSETRSQELDSFYHDIGQYYWLKKESFLKSKKLVTDSTLGLKTEPIYCQDIDNLSDWDIAEFKHKYLMEKGLIN